MGEINIKYQYPYDPEYEFTARMERIDLDAERELDIRTGNGFIVSEPQGIKKDLKARNGIFSSKFGPNLNDKSGPFQDQYKCECGLINSRFKMGEICPQCHTPVQYIGDNFKYFGWIVLNEYYVIHPNLYKAIATFIGGDKLNNIINFVSEKDENGYTIISDTKPKNEPFFGLGMIGFKDRLKEVMDYYLKLNGKKDFYEDIMKNEKIVFTQSIPVYTTHLRPYKIEGQTLFFEGTNAFYNLITRLVASVNTNSLKIQRKAKPKNLLLYDIQIEINKIYTEIENILAQKRGVVRTLFGGRYNFTARSVIVGVPELRSDEVRLPYAALVELLQQRLVNILHMSYGNYSPVTAYNKVAKAQFNYDPEIADLIEYIIKDSGRGIPVLINRNPTMDVIMSDYLVAS